jgi:hypothetical protein
MSTHTPDDIRVIPLRGKPRRGAERPEKHPESRPEAPVPALREPLWRDLVGDVLRQERQAQERTLKDVADAARISLPYLSEVERGRKEASSEVLAAAAQALGLGLGDLLSRVQSELTRQSTAPRTSVTPTRGLCLAA